MGHLLETYTYYLDQCLETRDWGVIIVCALCVHSVASDGGAKMFGSYTRTGLVVEGHFLKGNKEIKQGCLPQTI